MLTTAGRLVFAGDGGGNIVAHDAATGTPLWHSKIGNVTNPPQTYLIDGASTCSSPPATRCMRL